MNKLKNKWLNYKSRKIKISKRTLLIKIMFSFVLIAYAGSLLPGIFNFWFNISSSIPYGIYRIVNRYPQKDDYILFCLNRKIAKISSQRGYVTHGNCSFQSAPVGKKVVAVQGDHVKISPDGIEINGIKLPFSNPQKYDFRMRKLPEFRINRFLDNNEYIVASSKENSYDSRYFGIVRGEQIKGVIVKQ